VNSIYGFAELPITLRHAEAVRALPLHHDDPFDRLLIAQAIAEGLTVVTSDRKFEPYRVLVQWL
jgi:PIN domain nuclease of toxin-antitoxin system